MIHTLHFRVRGGAARGSERHARVRPQQPQRVLQRQAALLQRAPARRQRGARGAAGRRARHGRRHLLGLRREQLLYV